MVDAKIENTYCVFYFSTTEISSVGQTMTSLPQSGSYSNVRFDIDDTNSYPFIGTWTSYGSNDDNANITMTITPGYVNITGDSYISGTNLSYSYSNGILEINLGDGNIFSGYYSNPMYFLFNSNNYIFNMS
jgi:hypothetical protein